MNESGFISATVLTPQFVDSIREDHTEVFKRYHSLRKSPTIEAVLNAVPYMSMVLNKHRQVIFCNSAMLDMMSISDISDVIGMQPGEIIHCVHASTEPVECGTEEHCQVCSAAVRTVLRCYYEGVATSDEARLTIGFDQTTQTMDVSVSANPFEFEGDRYVIVTIRDINDEKRSQSLERIFLHDIANVVGGIVGVVDLLYTKGSNNRDDMKLLNTIVQQLYDEIHTQQQLIKAEKNELEVTPALIDVSELLRDVAKLFRTKMNGYTRRVDVRSPEVVIPFYSDRTLVFRVLCNMVKNAIEASRKNEPVTICSEIVGNTIIFKVHNTAVIPYSVQLQVFQRSFSTHGKGRGFGTYSMKLLSERYLKGKVYFRSTEAEGTTFYASYPIDFRDVYSTLKLV